jgi:hypothetical protein
MNTVHATWEQANLGVNACETTLSQADTVAAYAVAEQELLAGGAEYLVVKPPVNCPEFLFASRSLVMPLWKPCSTFPSGAVNITCPLPSRGSTGA